MSDGLSGLVNGIIAWADRLQREHDVLGFPYAVVKKYGDDEGGRQAALITYYGFLSIFPLLLLGVAVLSRVLADHPDLRLRLIAEIVPPALRSTVEHSLATLPTSTIPFVAGLIGLPTLIPPAGRRGHHRLAAAGGARSVVDQLGTDRQDHDPAKRRASGGRTLGQRSGWSVIGVTATGRPGAGRRDRTELRSRPRHAPPGP